MNFSSWIYWIWGGASVASKNQRLKHIRSGSDWQVEEGDMPGMLKNKTLPPGAFDVV